MKTFAEYLSDESVEKGLKEVLISLGEAAKDIAIAVRKSEGQKLATHNVFGETQLALDVYSGQVLEEYLVKNSHVGMVASEELDDEKQIGNGEYAVCYDPLDGSSLVDSNLSVGTIIGIYKANSFKGVKGDDQIAAMIAVYGPALTIFLTVRKGVVHLRLNEEGEFVVMKDNIKVEEKKMFAPGNLRVCKNRKDYLDLVNFWIKEQYTLRYSGGMVPDINQILLKSGGIFAYPGDQDEPDGKLRLLYECAPMALLVEEAGGAASDGKVRILEKEVQNLNQRTPIFIGGQEEVKRCMQYLAS